VSVLLIHASGPDKPGIIGGLLGPLVRNDIRVLDIGQAVIHRSLSLGVLVELPPAAEHTALMEEILVAGEQLGMTVAFSPVSSEHYEDWVSRQGEPRHIITVFGAPLCAAQLTRISDIAARFGLNVAVVTRLSGRPSLKQPEIDSSACVELNVRGTPSNASELRREILSAAKDLECDIAIQVDDMYRRNRRMIVFDMDSTLIQTEVINELARVHGVTEQVAQITEAAMNGELDFDQSLRRRLGLLKGLDTGVMDNIARSLPLTPGAERLVHTVRSLGYKTAILSGGFTYFGEFLKSKLSIDYVFANELQIENGALTGEVVGPIVNGQRKAQLLKEIAQREGIRLEQVVAVGDGANDLPMLNVAGLGIAFHAKPVVRESAKQQISTAGLDGILYMLGVRDREVPPAAPARGSGRWIKKQP
jgi:phosphoserine phosphatase